MFVGGVEGEGSRRPIVAMWMDTNIVSKGCDFDVSDSHRGKTGTVGRFSPPSGRASRWRGLSSVLFIGERGVAKRGRRPAAVREERARGHYCAACCHCDPTSIHDTRFPPAARFRGQIHHHSSTSRAGRSWLCLSFRRCGTASHNGHASACGPSLSSACDRARVRACLRWCRRTFNSVWRHLVHAPLGAA